MGGRVSANFQKKIQNHKKAQNRFQKCPHVFWTCFGTIFPNFFAKCSMQGFSGIKNMSSVSWTQK